MGKKRILIIAEKIFHKYYRHLSFNNEILKIIACEDASQEIKANQIQLIVIDCGFNIDLGLRLLRKAKNTDPSIPVVLLTDESSEDLVIKAFRTGARDYFPKPVDIATLQSSINRILEMRKITQDKRIPLIKMESTQSEFFSNIDWTHIPFRLFKAVSYIEENLSRKITLNDCAKVANLSKYYFARNFKEFFGMGPMEYVNYCRIQRAKIFLQREELSITEVAFAVGFNNYSNFFRCFKKVMGISPEKYKISLS